MKKTQKKDAIRNIHRQRVSFISIVVIAAMAVTAYLGISFSSAALKENGNEFYSETHFRDMEVLSTLLMSEDDFEVLRNTPGVADVEGVCQTSGKISFADQTDDAYVVSLTERINTVKIVSGRLPSSSDECVVEKAIAIAMGIKEGDEITVDDGEGKVPQFLGRNTFRVVGIVLHPDHLGNPAQVPGNRYVIVQKEAFDWETYPECFLKAEILIEKDPSLNRFSNAYYRAIGPTEETLRGMGDERAEIRTETVIDENQQKIDEGQTALDEAAAQLSEARAQLDEGNEKVKQGEQDLADAQTEIETNESKLAEALNQLREASAWLESAWEQLEEAFAQLTDAQALVDKGQEELTAAKEKLDEGKAELSSAKEQLITGFSQLEDAKQAIRDRAAQAIGLVLGEQANGIEWASRISEIDVDDVDLSATYFWITNSVGVDLNKTVSDQMEQIITSLGLTDEKLLEAYENTTGSPLEVREGESVTAALAREANSRYADLDEKYEEFASAARSWNEGHEEYLTGLGEYVQGLSVYEESLAIWEEGRDALRAKWEEYDQGVAEYEAGLSQYEEGLAAYEEGVAKLDEGKEQYLAGLEELQNTKDKLKEGEEQYKEGLSDYEEGKDRLQEAQDKLDNMEEGRWVFFGVQGNTSYMHLMYSAESTSKLSLTFSMMFIVIAALVIYATVGRIVQEQRKLIGTTKALGFFNREILAKYMLFGLGSTFIGTVLGIAIAYFGIEPILLGTYQMAYVLDGIERKIQILTTFLVAFGALGLAAAAVYLACRSQLRSTAISLMQEQMPKGKKASSGKERHSGGQQTGRLYNRLILRNIRSDIPRVAVTIVSVAGCCALLVIGFTLRGAVSGAIDRQYGQIIRFDYRLVFNPQQAKNAEKELETILREEGTDYVAVQDEVRLYRPAEKLDMTELVVGDMEQLSRFYAFTDWQSGQPLKIPASGAILKGRIAEANAVEAGGKITIYNDLMKPFPVTVEAMYQNYIGRELFISNETYKEVFGEEMIPNTFLIRLQGADPDKLAERLSKVEGFESFETSATEKAKFEDYTKVLTLISLLLTLVAGLMAYFILLNICNMYISQKKRELVIMRINGFTVREVKNYVARETVYTTVAGILLGLGFGSAVGYQIIRFVELPYVQFVRGINLTAWALAVVITLAFVWFINYLSLRQVSHLKLTDM